MAIHEADVSDAASPEQYESRSVPGALALDRDVRTLRILRTVQELEEFRETWMLWCEDPNADLDYYLVCARCNVGFVRPHVMVVYREGRPDCMLVGRLEHRPLQLRVGYKSLFQFTIQQLFFVQGGFLGNTNKENSEFLTRELRRCLRRREAQGAELTRLTRESALWKSAESEFGILSRGHFTQLHEHRWVQLPENFQEFLKNLSCKSRHELRRHKNKLANEFPGRTHIHCYRGEEEVAELAQEVEKVSAKTYQRGLGVGFRPDTETMESLRTIARQGGLRGCVLYLDDQPCAFFIGKHYRHTFHGNFMGFDPQFAKYSPGLFVPMHSIEECFDPEMRANQFDLGWGDRQYKRMICNKSRQDGQLYLYELSLAGLRFNLLRSTTSLIDLIARKLLAKSTLLQKLRKTLRTRASRSPSLSLEEECLE